MAREPELSIKVKVDPQINPSSLKTSIERQVKQSGEKPKIEIDPNVDGIKGKIEEKLKNVKATATVTPVVDIEKIKTDIQRQINGISDMPKVTVGVDVNNFSNELSEQLKTQLKEVNQQLSYYLKNLTRNTSNLGSFAENIFSIKGVAPAAQKAVKNAVDEATQAAKTSKKVFNINDLFNFKISDSTKKKSLSEIEDLTMNVTEGLDELRKSVESWDQKKISTKEFNDGLTKLKSNALELKSIISSFNTALNSDNSGVKAFLDLLKQNGFDLATNTGSFQNLESLLELLTNFDENFKTPTEAFKFVDSLDEEAKHYDKDLRRLCQNAISEFGDIQDKSAETISNIKAINIETKKAQQELKVNKADDKSGYLDASTIEAYGNAIDRVLGNIAQKQEDINAKRQEAINLEKNILSNTALTREGLSHELEEYTKVLNKFDTEKITKLAANLKDTRVAAEQSVPKELVHPVAQPSKKEPTKFAGGGIPGFNEGLKNNKKTEETVIPVKGKVTITDADITVDVKNPVKIPSVAVIDSSAAQIGNTDDLNVSANALASANKSLNGIASKTDRYVSNISALGPAFQYVAQEVDNLSHSLESQIIDFDRISEQTNAYIGKAGSILINTSNVATTGEPTTINNKVMLTANDIVPPEEPVDIKGHVELKISDIIPPSEPVELQGKIAKMTMESTAKGKKKKGQDVEKPEVVELNGHVKLEDKDIERPDPVVMNGKVVVTKNNIKLPEGGIDVKGNLILKNAEIANAIKEAAGKESGKKDASAASGNETKKESFNRAGKEAHLGYLVTKMGENGTYWQSAISKGNSKKRALHARKSVELEKDFEDTTRELIENLTDEEKNAIEAIKKQKINWSDTDSLLKDKTISWPWEESKAYLDGVNKAASGVELYNASETDKAKKRNGYEKEYVELIKQKPALIKAAAEAKKQYGEDSDAYKDAVRAKKENEEALHAINPNRQKVGAPRGNVGGGYSNSPAVQGALTDIHKQVQNRRSELLLQKAKESKGADDKQTQEVKKILSDAFIEQVKAYADGLKESSKYDDGDVSESAKTARKQTNEAFDSANKKFLTLLDVLSGNEIDQLTVKARKELDSANKIVDRRIASRKDKNKNAQNEQYEKLKTQLSDAQKIYGAAEDAEAADKIPTSIQEALRTQQQLITAIANTIVGTEEYNNAIKAAEDNWKNVAAAIEVSNKAQRSLGNQTNTLLRKFELLKEEVSQSSNDELKNSIEGIITRARDLNAKDPRTYENYANDLLQLRQDSYAVQAKHTLWRKGYKGLEKKGNQIAQGVEVARQMQEDGSLQGVDFKNIDELIAKLNTLPAQSDTYAETLKEIDTLWQEIKKKVDAVNESEKQAVKKQTAKIRDVKNILTAQRQNKNLIETVRGNNGSGEEFYSQLSEKQSKLNLLFEAIDGASDSEQALKAWASQNLKESADNINSVTDAIRTLDKEYNDAQSSAESFNRTISQERSTNKAATEVANLKSKIHDYLETNKKLQGTDIGKKFYKLFEALNQSDAPQKVGELKKQYAELRNESKELGLETESLIDKFEKLFGTHLSTMITMAALHKMQDALRIVYQNVVEIDSAMTELRKVTNLTASGYENFMDRAADQAQKLGISISDFINSTADWARLGYDEQDAEELARVSSLLKNVGDGIESASDASSYLISGMQGFGLAADQASEFLDVLNQIADTEPVTANDLGVIMQKSAAAMNAAGNTYQETMAMAAAVNGVLQDNDVSGTYLKTLSMYLRAAKTDAENAGIEIDGMASSVSELRNELKQLTGVDIMSDAAGKNFKSTYQIMEELSKVWGNLSDVTQANVTELISGKRGGQATSALLNNFSVAEDAMKQAANSAGSALAENAKYLDSIQGRLAQLDTSFQSLSTHVLDSGTVKYAVSFLTTIIKITDNITKLSGALPPIAAAVSGILSVMQMNGKLENGAGKVNMPAYARCA